MALHHSINESFVHFRTKIWPPLTCFLTNYYKSLMLVLVPVIVGVFPIVVATPESRCAFVVIVMAVFWIFDILHFAIVSIIPIFAFPLLGISNTNDLCEVYMNEANVIFLAMLMVGISLQKSGIHRRIALFILCKVGFSPKRLLFGVMLATLMLSTWIMDVAAAALMIPIVESIFNHLNAVDTGHDDHSPRLSSADQCDVDVFDDDEVKATDDCEDNSSDISTQQKNSRTESCVVLSVAYAAALGGIGTLTGTSTNLIFQQIADATYGPKVDVNYSTWIMFGFPTMIANMLTLYLLLIIVFLGFRRQTHTDKINNRVLPVLKKHREQLGPISFREYSMMICVLLLVMLWFFQTPNFMKGWQAYLPIKIEISPAVPGVLVIFLLCVLPSTWPPTLRANTKDLDHLMEWPEMEKSIPWDIFLLQGCGLAIAVAAQDSGLTNWFGTQFYVLRNLPMIVLCYLISLCTAFMSEIIANSSVAAMVLPIMVELSSELKKNPLFFMFPITMASTLAFALPIASAPNAMAYKTGKIPIKRMVAIGLIADILTNATVMLMINTLGTVVFQLNTYPRWAAVNITSVVI